MTIYQVLGITEEASIDEVRAAYSKKLKDIDMSKNIEDYRELREAYNKILKILNKRETYLYQEVTTLKKPNVTVQKKTPNIENSSKTPLTKSTDKKITTLIEKKQERPIEAPVETHQTDFPEQLAKFILNKTFYNDTTGWTFLISPYLNGTNETREIVVTTIKVYLLRNHKLLDDRTRLELIHLCKITEEDYDTGEDKRIFREKIKKENFLNYDFFDKISKDFRNQYFKGRYQLHEFIQVDDSEEVILQTDINDLKQLSVPDDDDLFYFFSLYELIDSSSPNFSEVRKNLNTIQQDKYRHDVEVLSTYTTALEGKKHHNINKSSVDSLSWASENIKIKLVNQLNKATLAKEKVEKKQSRVVKKKSLKNIGEKEHSFSLKKIPYFIFGFLILLSVGSSILEEVPFPSSDNEELVDNGSDDQSNAEMLKYKIENRKNNLSLNYQIYDYLFVDTPISKENNPSFSDELITSIEKFKEDNKTAFEKLNINSIDEMRKKSHEVHYFTEDNQLISYTTFTDYTDFSIKTTVDKDNVITKMEAVKPEYLPKNMTLGTYDTVKFFKEELVSNYDRLDRYLSNLSELHETYLTENAYDMLQEMDEDMYNSLSKFSFNAPILLNTTDSDNEILALYYDKQFLFIELNQENKIETFYSELFENMPEELLKQAEKIDTDQIDYDPWQFQLG
ncbi:hypothetical protein [Vagococcus sp.]|uniref:hypothetical protein n=1 Tax=Vagococcus sp. TaxID=1933889 RepID=UPI002FC9681E